MWYPQLRYLVIGALLVAVLPLGGYTSVAAAPSWAGSLYGNNLIVSGNAEAGPGAMGDLNTDLPPGWKTPALPGTGAVVVIRYAANEDLSSTTPGPMNRGKNYFYGGAGVGKNTSAEQRIDLSTAATAIDTGGVTFTLSGWLGGYSDQRDDSLLRASFLGVGGTLVGVTTLGPVTAAMRKSTSELLDVHATQHVPTGTRTVVLDLIMQFYDGSDNDGMADNLSLVLTAPATPGAAPTPGATTCVALPPAHAVALFAPANAAVETPGATIHFAWQAVPCAVWYDVQVWLQRGVAGQPLSGASATITAQRVNMNTFILPTTGWAHGVYAWRVIAATANGSVFGAWSPLRTFTLQ